MLSFNLEAKKSKNARRLSECAIVMYTALRIQENASPHCYLGGNSSVSVFGRENPVRSFRRPRASLSQWMLITVAPPLLSPLLTDGSIQCSVTAASFLREKFLLHFPDHK